MEKEKIRDLCEKCLASANGKGTQINFFEECRNAKRGELRCYPIDDTVIMAFDIRKEELARYTEPKYAKYHWSSILEDILVKRGALADRGILRDCDE